MTPIDLDQHATTPLRPAALAAMLPFLTGRCGNPSSAHRLGRAARQALDDARERVAHHLGATPGEVVFTSGATEANNLALFGAVLGPSSVVLSSDIEHPCVTGPLAARGVAVRKMDVDPRGVVRVPDATDAAFGVLMLANHETGAVQPVRQLAELVPVHCDAAQAVGKISVSFRDLGATTLAASGHKFGGPRGVGVLLVKAGTTLTPLLHGGHQQRGVRPGTEAVPLAVGFAAALDDAVRELSDTAARLTRLRQQLLAKLEADVPPVVVNGPRPGDPDGLPTALNVSFPGLRADVLLMALDLAGVACGTGSACSSGSLLPSPVLAAMGVPDDVLRSAIRFTLGRDTSDADVAAAGERIAGCVRRARGT